MRIAPIKDNTFKAKFSSYPKTITDPKVMEMFEQNTKNFPKLKLLQDDISYRKGDHFFLLDEKGRVLGFSEESFTNNYPRTLEGVVGRLVEIFDKLVKRAKLAL